MAEKVLAAVRTAPGRTELREFPMPDIPDDGALLRVEAAGICGTDVKMYAKPPFPDPVIMGHENIGVIAKAGKTFAERQGVSEGDRVFVEHYVGCMQCEWCRIGEYRHCELTDWRTNPDARRFGYTSADNPYHLWGGFAQYMFLPWNSVLHKIPDGLSPELAGLATPMSNGIEWALFAAGVGYDSTVLIQGPGQQGLSQTVACKQAGASLIIVTGTTKDKARLEMALKLGADYVIDVQTEDPLARIMEITGGKGLDVVLDCTSGAGTAPVLLGIDALKRREGTLLIQGEVAAFPDFPVKKATEKAITIKSARGHSYRACELAVKQLASGRFPLDLLVTHTFGLSEVDRAIEALGGTGQDQDVIHVNLLPWQA
ncbi:MAG TPA: zinc-binding dehydrogenase [Trebonia sp.]|jgi:threonine dehydrogenase-like Zn-dependent dehydrogenase